MTINDLVLIRNTITPVALVKVKSDAFLEAFPDENLDWFPLRREVDVLDVFSEKEEELLKSILKKHNKRQIQALGTLTLCKTKTATREFIEKWFENL